MLLAGAFTVVGAFSIFMLALGLFSLQQSWSSTEWYAVFLLPLFIPFAILYGSLFALFVPYAVAMYLSLLFVDEAEVT